MALSCVCPCGVKYENFRSNCLGFMLNCLLIVPFSTNILSVRQFLNEIDNDLMSPLIYLNFSLTKDDVLNVN